MNPSEKEEDKIERSARDDAEKESAENREPAEVEEDKEKTEVVTKEAMLRVTGGQL
ncbi:MAG: hypothetical protein JO066_08610 [Verrucomicrobia bacterium]|nr:hypothetical protein [Verrucomicrobiota bacterium]